MQPALTVSAFCEDSTDLIIKTDGTLQTSLTLKGRWRGLRTLVSILLLNLVWSQKRKMELFQLVLSNYWHERQHQRIQTRKGQELMALCFVLFWWKGTRRQAEIPTPVRQLLRSGQANCEASYKTRQSECNGRTTVPKYCQQILCQTLSIESITEAGISPYFLKGHNEKSHPQTP